MVKKHPICVSSGHLWYRPYPESSLYMEKPELKRCKRCGIWNDQKDEISIYERESIRDRTPNKGIVSK